MTKVKLSIKYINKFETNIKEIIKKSCAAVLIAENYRQNVEISVTLTGDETIRSLNKLYRNKNKVTDVLSFPMNEKNPDNGFILLGDIIINIEQAKRQAEKYGHSLKREIAFLTIHSMLHLFGYDHKQKRDEIKMRRKQTELLKDMGLGYKKDER